MQHTFLFHQASGEHQSVRFLRSFAGHEGLPKVHAHRRDMDSIRSRPALRCADLGQAAADHADGIGLAGHPAAQARKHLATQAEHVAALKAYASGERDDPSGMMADYAVDLSEQDMADLAAYYATLE